MKQSRKVVIGITGGISTGKSFVMKIFKELGCAVFNCDVVAKEILDDKNVLEKVKGEFSECFNDKLLDRKKLRSIIFSDEASRRKLDAITHPAIYNRVQELVREIESDIVAVEIPLLFEASFEKLVGYIVCVVCSTSEQIKRLIARDNINKAEATKAINSQMPLAEKVKRSNTVVDTALGEESVKKQVKEILKRLDNK
ncbi:MAG: dephospho-CoA kinase [Firmicutes bacterium]|nr:dephospho-CoA kinase [Bacillota bacterium]